MLTALVRTPSPRLAEGEVTFIGRTPVDPILAAHQHAAYAAALKECGAQVVELPCLEDLPDSVFVEDTAVMLDEVAVLCSLGAESRHAESDYMRPALAGYRQIVEVRPPATLEGGDVLRIGKILFVGRSTRTNDAGIQALKQIGEPFGYTVIPVEVRGCLHLKTAVTALDDSTLLTNPAWIDASHFEGYDLITVREAEPFAANILQIGDRVLAQSAYPRTAELLTARGFDVRLVNISEFAKIEAGLTCMSLIFDRDMK